MVRPKALIVAELSRLPNQLVCFFTSAELYKYAFFKFEFTFSDPFDAANGKVPSSVNEVVTYPNNLTVRDLYFFMAVPSLCYELNFPRTSRIRKRFLLKRAVEVFVGMQVVLGLFQQWIIPSVKNSLDTFSVSICYSWLIPINSKRNSMYFYIAENGTTSCH